METRIYFRHLWCFQQRISLRMKLDFCTLLAWKAVASVRLIAKLVVLFVVLFRQLAFGPPSVPPYVASR